MQFGGESWTASLAIQPDLLTMARRQATAKTATPGDNSSPPAELKGEEAPSASDLAIQAARKEDTQNGSHGDQGTTPKKVCEQDAIPAGDHVGGKQDASVLKSSLVKCALGKCVNFYQFLASCGAKLPQQQLGLN